MRTLLLAFLFAVGIGLPASTHATLIASDPVGGGTLSTAPSRVLLTFSEPVELALGGVRVFGPAGERLDVGRVAHGSQGAHTVSVRLRDQAPEGTRTVSWRVVSGDSHPVNGAFTFSVGRPSGTSAQAEGDSSNLLAVLAGLGRGLAIAGFVLLVGGTIFLWRCWPTGFGVRRSRRMLWAALAGLFAASAAGLLLQGPYGAGLGLLAVFDLEVLSATMETRLGIGLTVRLALIALAAGYLAWLLRARPTRARLPALVGLLLGVALAATWSATGHASVGSLPPLAIAADALHLLAVATWLGGLTVLAMVALRRTAPEADLLPAVQRFSSMALPAVAIMVVTGGYQAWRQVWPPAALFTTAYGQALGLKLLAFAGILGLAWLSRSWIRRIGSLRRSVSGEMALAGVVLVLTTVLISLEPGRTAYGAPVSASAPFTTADMGGSVSVVLTPARTGPNTLQIHVVDAAGGHRPIPEVRAELDLPEREIGPLPVTLASTGPGSYSADAVALTFAGEWRLAVVVRTSDAEQKTVMFAVEIR